MLILAGCALPGLGARSFPPTNLEGESSTSQPGAQPAMLVTRTTEQRPTSVIAQAPTSTAQWSSQNLVNKAPAIFSIPALQPPPAGILPLVNILQAGGGSGIQASGCEAQPGAPHWCKPLDGATLPITAEIQVFACGLGSSAVQATLRLPDGSSQLLEVQGEPPFCREIVFHSTPQTPPGRYQVQVVQDNTTLVDTFQYVLPNHPVGAQLGSCAWLTGLAPRQTVKLLVFGLGVPDSVTDPLLTSWRYLAEIRLPSDAEGVLWACPSQADQTPYSKLSYLADLPAGYLALDEEEILRSFQGFCADGPAARLSIGTRFRVIQKGLPVFPDPSLEDRLIGTQDTESKGTILSGPVCPPEGPWTWKAVFENGLVGWIAESDAANYFIEPVH